jgi:hypothetical protein
VDIVLVIGLVAAAPFAVLTAIGSYHRTGEASLAVVSGVFFPATWVAWYVRDELPRRRSG